MTHLFFVQVAMLCFVSMAFGVAANEGSPQTGTILERVLSDQSVERLSTALTIRSFKGR